jgi:hypothetical protein
MMRWSCAGGLPPRSYSEIEFGAYQTLMFLIVRDWVETCETSAKLGKKGHVLSIGAAWK